MKRIFAFTLAEVLITLGIIGIVAAMTLPVLIQKYNKIVWYTQFRKAATQLEQALKLYQIDHGCEGDIYGCGNGNRYGSLWLPMQVPNFVDDLAKYFNTTVSFLLFIVRTVFPPYAFDVTVTGLLITRAVILVVPFNSQIFVSLVAK